MSIAGRIGNEILVNSTTPNAQYDPAVTALANGGFVVTWQDESLTGDDTSGAAIRAQIYAADGTRSGSELLVNTTTSQTQIRPTVTGLTDGRFVVAWEDGSGTTGDGSGQAVRGRIFNGDGTESVAEFLIPVTVDASQREPAIAALPNGGFVAVWTDFSGFQDIHPSSVRAQVFDAQGQRVGAEFRVNTTLPNPQWQPTVAVFPDGHFVVAWTDLSGAGGDPSPAIRAQVFEHNGAPRGGEILVNTTTFNAQQYPSIAASADGHFAIVWQDTSQDAGNIRAQVFNPDGSPSGNEFVVNSSTGLLQSDPTVTALPDGRFVAAWTDGSASVGDVSGAAIRAQVFTADGTLSGPEFLVNTTTANAQSRPTVTTLAGGRFVIAWEDMSLTGGDTSGFAIRAQVFMLGEPPVITSNGGGDAAAISVAENASTVTIVTATDADSPTLTYAIAGGADAALFQIDAATGLLSFINAPNFEAPADADHDNKYDVVVRASDGTFNDTQAITVTVNNVNEPPHLPFSDVTTNAAENSTSVIATVHGSDPEGAALTYSISGGADAAHFAIDAATGALSFVAPRDFELPEDADHNNRYAVTVHVSDGTLFTEANINVVVEDVNEAPTIADPDFFAVTENGTTVATIAASDPDGDDLTYSIADAVDSEFFQIDPVSGVLSFITPPDFDAPADLDGDNMYHVRVRASDGTLFTERGIVIQVSNVNEAPVINGGDDLSVSRDENTTNVATIHATDADGADIIYSISGGADALLFQIDSASGVLSFRSAPDFEAPADADHDNSYVVLVRASDGLLYDEQAITVGVENANEQPFFKGGGGDVEVQVPENETSVDQVKGFDPDGDNLTYSISGGADGDLFQIDAATGDIAFIVPPDFEAPADANDDNRYDVRVRISDGSLFAERNVTVVVTDVVETPAPNALPTIESNGGGDSAAVSVSENTTAVTTVAATDPDEDVLTYSIAGGADAARFQINASTGILSFVAAPDFEAPADADHNNSYVVTVRASDGTLFDEQTITVNVGNVAGLNIVGDANENYLTGSIENDTIYGRAANDRLRGGGGADVLNGEGGNDTADYLDGAAVTVTLAAGTANNGSVDTLISIERVIGSQFGDTLHGTDGDNVLDGADGVDFIEGRGGNDRLEGGASNDTLNGGAGADEVVGQSGDDIIVGGTGADKLSGGPGVDIFVWASCAETGITTATADVMQDFSFTAGDRIRLSGIDANVYAAGDQAFTFIGTAAFSGTPGELRYYHAGGNTYLEMQTGTAVDIEGVIRLDGIHTPQASWFML